MAGLRRHNSKGSDAQAAPAHQEGADLPEHAWTGFPTPRSNVSFQHTDVLLVFPGPNLLVTTIAATCVHAGREAEAGARPRAG